MISLQSKYAILGLLLLGLGLFTGCEKEQIAPSNQSVVFIKYYGHVANQTGTDLIRMSDGGYIMVGSTSSYTTQTERDIFIVRTDSLGNEVWSSTIGKTRIIGTKTTRFDEEGVSIEAYPDESLLVLAANRSYIEYQTENSTNGLLQKTKIVMYHIDPTTGRPTIEDGTELRSSTSFTEKVKDIKIDDANGLFKYALVGHTTNVSTTKPAYAAFARFDATDVFIARLFDDFQIEWTAGLQGSGFLGEDYANSIQIMPDAYLVSGTTEVDYLVQGDTLLIPQLFVAKLKDYNGVTFNIQDFGDITHSLEGGYVIYDASNLRVTIAGNVLRDDNNTNNNQGKLFMLQLNTDLQPVAPSGPSTDFYFKFFSPPTNSFNAAFAPSYVAESICMSGDNGYVIAATHQRDLLEDNIAVVKVDQNFELEWAETFGYEDSYSLNNSTKEKAGTIIAVTEAIDGVVGQRDLTGYALTGTFGLGTNYAMGLVKMNTSGTLKK